MDKQQPIALMGKPKFPKPVTLVNDEHGERVCHWQDPHFVPGGGWAGARFTKTSIPR